jgi:diguanylate cyclase (GGDEF)-like protein
MNEAPRSADRARILIVDDERFNLNALNGLLKDDYKVMVATTGAQGLKAARTGLPDLILLDISMPDTDGYEVCRQLKADPNTQNIPIIFVTALTDAADETRALDLGASDYISKPFNPSVVHARVRTQLRMKQQNDLLERFAFLDSLTGLSNRRAFEDRGTTEWNRCLRAAAPLSVILLDVDHFKLYNDTYGHGAGDECLRRVARALSGSLERAGDLVARYGGEEFVVVLPDTDQAGALRVAERLRRAVEEQRIEHSGSKAAPHVTVSLGVATAVPVLVGGLTILLELADRMLYECKAAGRNGVRGIDHTG